MRLDDEVYEYIKKEVCNIIVRYNVTCIPINGFELADKLGIEIIKYSSLSGQQKSKANYISKDGFYLEMNNGKEYIYYNDEMGKERSNMTILHEIGHSVLGHTEDMDLVAEAEAAFFAKYAAAPPPLVDIVGAKSAEDIAREFALSREASNNAWVYYLGWKEFHVKHGDYTEYEKRLVDYVTLSLDKNKGR